jgi:hypothetical protein
MRKRQSFLLTILTPENAETSLCGKIKVISSGKICTFASIEELYKLISTEMDEEDDCRLPVSSTSSRKTVEEQILSS